MVKLRLKRCGRKQQAGIVAMDVEYGIDLWKVGLYDPITNQIYFYFPAIIDFLKKDAQPTRTVHDRLKEVGVFTELNLNKTKFN